MRHPYNLVGDQYALRAGQTIASGVSGRSRSAARQVTMAAITGTISRLYHAGSAAYCAVAPVVIVIRWSGSPIGK